MEKNCNSLVYGIAGIALLAVAYKVVPIILRRRMLNRWNKTPKNVVIFHGTVRGMRTPMPSPFVLKLETYFKIANIPYKLDTTDSFGPTGKTPWISYNGEHIGDSQMCIQYLNKKFEKNLNGSHSQEKLAIAHALRILLEEHFFWGLRLWIFVGEGRHTLANHIKMPWFQLQLFKLLYGMKIRSDTWAQGMTRHSNEDIEQMMIKDIRSVSYILGNNKFIIGDEPCEDDCAIFGFLANIIWGHPQESYCGKLIRDELPNIIGYCERMKAKFWPDWELCLNP